jgi:hypothetical protein
LNEATTAARFRGRAKSLLRGLVAVDPRKRRRAVEHQHFDSKLFVTEMRIPHRDEVTSIELMIASAWPLAASIEEFNSNYGPIFCSEPRDAREFPGVRRY